MKKPKVGCAEIIALVVIGSLFRLVWVWVVSILWIWFVVPAFHVAPLSMPLIYGLGLLMSLIRERPTTQEQSEKGFADLVAQSFVNCIMVPLLTLAFAWAVVKVWGPF